MNYLAHYQRLINRAKLRTLGGYKETHHIIPKCMGGTDDAANLVDLTPEEHFVAHQLLVRIYPKNYKLVNAAVMMTANSSGKRNNKLYGWIKRRLSIAMSKSQSGTNNSQHGTCWIHNKSYKVSKKISKESLQEFLNNGWTLGRVIIFDKPEKPNKREILKKETDLRYYNALVVCNSISDALRHLGLETRGAGYARMKQVILKYNLQSKFSHEYIKWNKSSVSISGDATGSYPVDQDSNS